MAPVFESAHADLAGRVGELSIPGTEATVETPALLPVVNPHLETISSADIGTSGAQILITNAYIFYGSDEYREQVLSEGLHDVFDFSGPIMTDSGSYQLAEYGKIDVTTQEILRFQRDIGADVATPVDIPTHPEADRARVERDLETTRDRLETAAAFDAGDMLLSAPVQGATFPDLRERAGRQARATDLDIFPIGGVVPLLREYRFDELVKVVVAAKNGLGPAGPVHLFGAGHPMMFALAAALGCDLFDSAAYALYAREGRYMTVRGTEHLEDLTEFPCSCPTCASSDPAEVRELDDEVLERHLAKHNLHVSFAEMRRVRQAIRDGTLIELVETRARSHPDMLDGYRTLLDHVAWIETHDPVRTGPFFYLSTESAERPAVYRYQQRLGRLNPPESLLLAPPDCSEDALDEAYEATWSIVPPFGPVPPALEHTAPLNAELPDDMDHVARERAVAGVAALFSAQEPFELGVLLGHWPDRVLQNLPDSVGVHSPS